jgi:superoxide reductase
MGGKIMEENKFYKDENNNIFALISGDNLDNKTPLKANIVDASIEKHVPVYEIKENKIIVKVGTNPHPMEAEHYIMWIAQVYENEMKVINLKPGMEATTQFDYLKGSTIYAYCNLHGLWKNNVE